MGWWEHNPPSSRQAPAARLRDGEVSRVGGNDGLIAFEQGVSNALASRFLARMAPHRADEALGGNHAMSRLMRPAEIARGRPAPQPVSRGSRNVLAREWQAKPQKRGGRGINTANRDVKRRLLALVPDMKIVEAGQMAKDDDDSTWRIDYQGPSHGPNGEDYVSMAAQVGTATFASCHCPANWGIEARRGGMTEAITRNDAIWWVAEAAVEEEETKTKPKPKPKKGGGGKKGQFGSRGGQHVKI